MSALVLSLLSLSYIPNSTCFAPITSKGRPTARRVSQLDKASTDETISNIPQALRTPGQGIPPRNSQIQLLDPSTYESQLIQSWNTPESQKGFDWEIEKARRFFAGLRLREDGVWVKKPSFFDFLVNQSRAASVSSDAPKPVNMIDVISLVTINILTNLGFGTGMAAVPDAVIQKYEGSFFSFIKGVLGGDLQTLAGGPLFLLLAKYYHDYGPIFNLSFGPKSFLVVSDPVMARHILRESTAEQYCKGMLAEILEPIMGKGLIPADPATWKVSAMCLCGRECRRRNHCAFRI